LETRFGTENVLSFDNKQPLTRVNFTPVQSPNPARINGTMFSYERAQDAHWYLDGSEKLF
jgi:hypothetical protein